MEHHANNSAPALSLLSILSSIFSWVSFAEAQYLLSFLVTIIGMVSGMMAIRYYWYAGNEKKRNLKNQ